ncbi:hypothetical protein THOG05_60024 [Vibrio rotiferianus]|nr:hypothetical protein THOG05_60024 [Vibrio rotiferianus]
MRALIFSLAIILTPIIQLEIVHFLKGEQIGNETQSNSSVVILVLKSTTKVVPP